MADFSPRSAALPGTGLDGLVERYREAFQRHGHSPEALFWPKGRQDLRFTALTAHFGADGFSILDFGCGLGHLKHFLDRRYRQYRYHGVDLVPEFVAECARTIPGSSFRQVRDVAEVDGRYDFVVLSGVFNMLYVPQREQHQAMVFDTLSRLFERTAVALSCDFLTDRVDFQQPGAFHMVEPELLEFVRRQLSPRFRLDHSYMPYEFAVTVFKDQRIARPANVFQALSDADPAAR